MTLRRRLGFLLAAVGVVLLALLTTAVVVLLDERDSQDTVVNDYYRAIQTSNDRLLALVDAETGLRGYALTGDPVTLEPARALERTRGVSSVPEIRAALGDDRPLLAALTTAEAAAQRWYTEWAVPTQQAVAQRGRSAVGADEVAEGKRLFDQIRVDYAAYLTLLRQDRADAFDTLKLQTSLLFGTVVGTLLVTALLAVAVMVLLVRWVVRPLDRLAVETRAVSSGDLGHEVAITGPAEVEALARDVDLMRQGLVSRLDEVRRAGEEVEASRLLLESQAEDLQRSNRDLEQFAYVASHDLQEPLRKVASFCQLLEKRYGGQLDERADQYIGFAVDGAKRMQALINDLLAFSRVGRMSAASTVVDLEQGLTVALRNLDLAIEDAGASVTHDPLPAVLGEGPLLTQLLQNLVGNAVKFHRPDVPPRVHLSVTEDGECWEFACSDNGIGIEAQYADRVFVIFQRLHPKDEYEGTGIGLALCRKIVEFHGGRIWIDPDSGSGATIRWTLPRMPVESLTSADLVTSAEQGATA